MKSYLQEVYRMLTLMDRVMLTHAKSTISCCMLSVITRQQASVDIESILLYRLTAVNISTYVHGDVQTPLGRFVVDILRQTELMELEI